MTNNNKRFLNWIPPDKITTLEEHTIPKKRKRKIPNENLSHEEEITNRTDHNNKAVKSSQHSKLKRNLKRCHNNNNNNSSNSNEKVEYHRFDTNNYRKKDKLLPEDVDKFIKSLQIGRASCRERVC